MKKVYENIIVEELDVVHTFRGHRNQVEVYTYQAGPKTYSLYKKKGDSEWRCDVTASYSHQDIALAGDASDASAMLKAFVAKVKELEFQPSH